MGKQSGYLKRKQQEIGVWRQATKDTYIQFMTDVVMITLNNPDVMGKDVFGEKRIADRVVPGMERIFDEYHGALEKGPEADYYQEKLDERLRKILKKRGVVPFQSRYDWVRKPKY